MSKSLYEISREYQDILDNPDYIDLETGEMSEEGCAALESNQEEKQQKLENIGRYIANQESLIAGCKAEEERFKKRRSRIEGKVESIKKYILSVTQGQKYSTDSFEFSTRASESVSIHDESMVPGEYVVTVPATTKIDLAAAKKAINAEVKVRAQEAKDDGKEFDTTEAKMQLFSEKGFSIEFRSNLTIK